MQILISNSKGGCGKTTLTMALADQLKAQIIEYDPQGTIADGYQLTKRHKPIKRDEVTSKYVIYDMPPYNTQKSKEIIEVADLIIIPCKVSMPDLLALKAIVQDLRNLGMQKKACIVFNEVRKPHNNTYKKVKEYYEHMYSDIKRANIELSNLVAFRDVMEKPLSGKAKEQITILVTELNIV